MYFDPVYLLIIGVTGALSMWASYRVKSTFSAWQKRGLRTGATGADIARGILAKSGIHDVEVERVSGFLSDHYDPRNKKLRLSPQVYDGRSVAAAGVAAHEVGHALQHAEKYWPLQVRSYLAPAASLGSNLGMILIVLGLATNALGLAKVGILVFSLMVAFVLITLPVEFDASGRAKKLLPALGYVDADEGRGVSKVLSAAAMTYVASAIGAIVQLLYWLVRAGMLGGRD